MCEDLIKMMKSKWRIYFYWKYEFTIL